MLTFGEDPVDVLLGAARISLRLAESQAADHRRMRRTGPLRWAEERVARHQAEIAALEHEMGATE
jgi:hypothetical protein